MAANTNCSNVDRRERRLRFENLESKLMLAVWTVTKHDDNGLGAGGTLSRAIMDANNGLASETQAINFNFTDKSYADIFVSGSLPIITASKFQISGTDLGLTGDQRAIIHGNGPNNTLTSLRFDGAASSNTAEWLVTDLRFNRIGS